MKVKELRELLFNLPDNDADIYIQDSCASRLMIKSYAYHDGAIYYDIVPCEKIIKNKES